MADTRWAAYYNDTRGVWRDTLEEAWADYRYYRSKPGCDHVRLVKESTTTEILMEEILKQKGENEQ